MNILKKLGFAPVIAGLFMAAAPHAAAQVGVNVNIGEPPVCPYGYYEVPPYDCAPDGSLWSRMVLGRYIYRGWTLVPRTGSFLRTRRSSSGLSQGLQRAAACSRRASGAKPRSV